MRAIVFDQPGDETVLHLGDVPAPIPGPDDLRIRVRATAVNRADLLQRQGLYPPPPGASAVLGLECAGEVVEVGANVTGWAPGDRAMALLPGGGYAEEAIVHSGSAIPVPAALNDVEAGAFPEVFLTAFLNIFLLADPRRRSAFARRPACESW
jgi:tumor protein p53-inducible protein 3